MTKKIAYLTIDDAPTPDLGKKVDMMRERNIPAVIFCQGNLMEENPDQVRYAIRNGFVIANHSYDHPKFSDITFAQAQDQILRTERIIDTLYGESGTARPAKIFRFPYGDKGDRIDGKADPASPESRRRHEALQNFLKETGFVQSWFPGNTCPGYVSRNLLEDLDWYWTYDVAEYIVARGYERFGIKEIKDVYTRMDLDDPEIGLGLNTPGYDEVILIHDNVETTRYWGDLLDALLAKGLKFEVPDF